MTKTNLHFTNTKTLDDLNIDASFFEERFNIDRKSFFGQYTDNEKNFLFNFVRKVDPKNIIDFSPAYGYTTCIMGTASRYESYDAYEIDEQCYKATKANVEANWLGDINVHLGDVFANIDKEKLKNCDLLFIDSDHSKEFCERYAKEFFPLLKKGCWVLIHDVWFTPVNPETEVVTQYIKENNITNYFYLMDVAKLYNIPDVAKNVLNDKEDITEESTSLYFRVQ